MCPCWPSEQSCNAVGFYYLQWLTTFPLAIKKSLQMLLKILSSFYFIFMLLIVLNSKHMHHNKYRRKAEMIYVFGSTYSQTEKV